MAVFRAQAVSGGSEFSIISGAVIPGKQGEVRKEKDLFALTTDQCYFHNTTERKGSFLAFKYSKDDQGCKTNDI
jgi:hypothetical protein